MVKVRVCAAIFLEKTVEIPEKCPKCQADLKAPSAVKEWAWGDGLYVGGLSPTGAPGEHYVQYDRQIDQGNSYYTMSISCVACGHDLARSGLCKIAVPAGNIDAADLMEAYEEAMEGDLP